MSTHENVYGICENLCKVPIYSKGQTDALVVGKADADHTHTKSDITDFDSHNHDSRYFTEAEVTNMLASKSNTEHTHTKSQITDLPSTYSASVITAGTLAGQVNANATAQSSVGTFQVRDAKITDTEPTEGSALDSGKIVFVI